MRLDYKSIIVKRYLLHLSLRDIAEQTGSSKSGVSDFLRAFEQAEGISYPLPPGITNEGIEALVYPSITASHSRDGSYQLPDFALIHKEMTTRKNMTLVYLWGKYDRACENSGLKAYSYRQYCTLFSKWCEQNDMAFTMPAYSGQSMEVDFAGNTFEMTDRLTGEILTIVVFVAVLPYSNRTYAEGMLSTKEPQWISVNNHALDFFGGVPAIIIPDNCKQRTYEPEGTIKHLSSLRFVENGMNVCILGASNSGKTYLAKAIGLSACSQYRVEYFCTEELVDSLMLLRRTDKKKFGSRKKHLCSIELLILDDFLLHSFTDEDEIKAIHEILNKRQEANKSTIICSQRMPHDWKAQILDDEVAADAIMKRATKHYTVMINLKEEL